MLWLASYTLDVTSQFQHDKDVEFDLHWKYHNKLERTCTKCQQNGPIEMKTKKGDPTEFAKS